MIIYNLDITVTLNTTIWKLLLYPLATTTLTEEDFNNIMRPTIMAALPRLGLNRSFPKTILFSPLKYQGFGLKHLHTLQMIAHLSSIIDHQLIPSITTSLYVGVFKNLYLHLGVGREFRRFKNYSIADDIPNSIVKYVWKSCSKWNIKIEHNINAPMLRNNHEFIMKSIYEYIKDPSEIVSVNGCQLYLQVLTLSEITIGDRETILPNILLRKRNTTKLRSFS